MTLTRYFMIALVLLLSLEGLSQSKPRSPEQIRNEMTEIRENTDWTDEVASARAQARIEELSKELMMAGKARQQQGQGIQADSARLEEEAEYKMSLWKQMLAAADQGEQGDVLLGKPIREEIVEAYKDDESPIIKNPKIYDEITLLCIDMSLPTVQRTIDQMEKFRSVQTLIITGGGKGSPVNLEDILYRARDYPLKYLYIINFRQYVTRLPSGIGNFTDLKLLAVFNNQLVTLPPETGYLANLQTLYVDLNPINTLFATIRNLSSLENLGIGKTGIPESEIDQIKALNPNCNIDQR